MHSIKDIKKQQYDYHKKLFPYLFDFKRNPYSYIKARFYMNCSSLLIFFLLKTKINPNSITILYALSGILTGFFLASNSKNLIFIGLIGKTSLTGHILDVFGAFLNSIGLHIGLGFYVAHNSNTIFFYYVIPILLSLRMANLYDYSKLIILNDIGSLYEKFKPTSSKSINNSNSSRASYIKKQFNQKLQKYFFGFLDDRARSVDLICLIIFLEFYYPINISPLILFAITFKYFIIFIISFFKVAKKGWAEDFIKSKLFSIYSQSKNKV